MSSFSKFFRIKKTKQLIFAKKKKTKRKTNKKLI